MDDEERAKELLNMTNGGGKLLALGKNSTGRCALHIAVLRENEKLVKLIVRMFPETLRIGDNVRVDIYTFEHIHARIKHRDKDKPVQSRQNSDFI